MKRLFKTTLSVVIGLLITSLAFGGFNQPFPNILSPIIHPDKSGVVFRFDAEHLRLVDRVSGTSLSQAYSGTNRTRINSSGLLETVAANTPVIDHIGTSLTPALRLEPAAGNILLEALTDWAQGSNAAAVKNATSWAGTANGAYTVTASANNGTLVSTAVTATSAKFTFVCAIKRSVGTGAVYMTIDNGTTWTEKTLTTSFQYFNVTKTAANPQLGFKFATSGDAIIVDMPMLLANTAIASSGFAVGSAIGSELVTDGGFAAVTETNSYTSNFSAGVDGFLATRGTATGNIDGISGQDDNLRLVYSADAGAHYVSKAFGTVGACYRVRLNYFFASGQTVISGITIALGTSLSSTYTTADAWANIDWYGNPASSGNVGVYGTAGTDPGADDVFYTRAIIVDSVTFNSWQNWYPQATSGALTNKAYKAASVSANLEQSACAATAGKVYQITWTLTKIAGDAGDGITAEFGSTDGTLRTSTGTYTDYIIAADTDYLKFKPTDADSNLVVTIDDVSVKECGTVRASESGTITLSTPTAVSTALTATGTLAMKVRFPYAKASTSVTTNLIAFANSATSFLYMTSAGVFTLNDGTNTATNDDSFSADTDYIIVARWNATDNDMDVGIGAPGAVAFDAAGTFDDAFADTATMYIGQTVGHPVYIEWIEIYNNELTAAQVNALR